MTLKDKAKLRVVCENYAVSEAEKLLKFASIGSTAITPEIHAALVNYAAIGATAAFSVLSREGLIPTED